MKMGLSLRLLFAVLSIWCSTAMADGSASLAKGAYRCVVKSGGNALFDAKGKKRLDFSKVIRSLKQKIKARQLVQVALGRRSISVNPKLALKEVSDCRDGKGAFQVTTPVSCTLAAQTTTLQANEASSVEITLSATSGCGDSIAYALHTYPQRGSLSGEAPNLKYTPTSHEVSADSFEFEARDLHGHITVGVVSISFLRSAEDFAGQSNSLIPYREQLSDDEIRHILNKVAFGGTPELIKIGRTKGLTALVDALLTEPDQNDTDNKAIEAAALYWAKLGFGQENSYLDPNKKISTWGSQALDYYWLYHLINARNPFYERMSLILHSHFALNFGDVPVPYNVYPDALKRHLDILRSHAFGSFLDLTESMLSDVAMNYWLNNTENSAISPNQNFARELMELFTLGQLDPITGEKNYDEDSVVAATAFVSGYHENWPLGIIDYQDRLHDFQPYTIFAGTKSVASGVQWRSSELIPYILYNHPGSSRYIAERFFAQLVNPKVPDMVVSQLAGTLLANGWELKPFLKKILMSSAMFARSSRDVCVNSPVEWLVRILRKLELRKNFPDIFYVLADTDNDPSTPMEWTTNPEFAYDTIRVGGMTYAIMGRLRIALLPTGEMPGYPFSVFGWPAQCGINRGGLKSHGEGWLSPQSILARESGLNLLLSYIGRADWLGGLCDHSKPKETCYWIKLLPSLENADKDSVESTAAAIADYFALEFFGFHLKDEDRADLVTYLTKLPASCTSSGCEFYKEEISYSPKTEADIGRVQTKVAGLIAILAQLSESYLR